MTTSGRSTYAASGEALPDLALSRAGVDRAAHRRTDEAWLAAAWADQGTRVFRFSNGRGDVTGEPPALTLTGPPDGCEADRYFLGIDEADRAFFAVEVAEGEAAGFRSLRDVGPLLGARDAGLLVNAVALGNWHATHQHCSRCGQPTTMAAAGHLRRCDGDGSEHFPRTDPAVIMAIVDEGDRILLGRQAHWESGRFSTLAGFVEPGESLEQAVRREVAEEVGVEVGPVRYLGSQPWPFPSSLMLGFLGHALTTSVQLIDGEIAEARWFSRAELAEAVRAGEVRLPSSVSIARRLVEHWYAEPLPAEPAARQTPP